MPPATTFNPFADQLIADADERQTAARQALIAAYSTPVMDPQATYGAALGGALPAIIGSLFGGKYGLQSGAQGGALGAKYGFDLAEAQGERGQKLAVQQATLDLEDAKDSKKAARTSILQDRKEEALVKRQEDSQKFQAELSDAKEDARTARFGQSLGAITSRSEERNDISRDTQLRVEADALDKNVINNASISKGKTVLNSAYRIKQILKEPLNQVTLGALRTQIPRFNEEVGNLAQAEQKNAVPGTAKESGSKALNFLAFGKDTEVVPPELQGALIKYVDDLESATRKRLEKEIGAMEKTADIDAPLMSKKQPENIKRKFSTYRDQILGSTEEEAPEMDPSKYDLTDPSQKEAYKEAYKAQRRQGM